MLHGFCGAQTLANLTLTLDPTLLKRARIRALEQGTSVNSVVRGYLQAYVGATQQDAIDSLLHMSELAQSGVNGQGRSWTRDELHER